MADFRGVFVGSPELKSYFDDYQLHSDVRQLTAALDPGLRSRLAVLPRPLHDSLRVAFVGNITRHRAFLDRVLPALVSLSRRQPVELFVPASVTVVAPNRELKVTPVPATGSYNEFLATWRAFGIDVVVHPRGRAAHKSFKNVHMMLTAWYLGAGLIVDAEEAAFKDIDEQCGVRRADTTKDWLAALDRCLSPAAREESDRRLEAAVLRMFDAGRNDEILWSALSETKPKNIFDLVKDSPVNIEYKIAPKPRTFGQKLLREFARAGKRYLDRTN